MAPTYIRWFDDVGSGDVASVGGKNASLGEMVRNLGRYGIKVPPGFAITADGYRRFLDANTLRPAIAARLAELASGTGFRRRDRTRDPGRNRERRLAGGSRRRHSPSLP